MSTDWAERTGEVMRVLEVNNITKTFPGVRALNDVSLDLNENEVLAVCGENGAGKSTLIKILSGIYPSGTYSGNIKFQEKEVNFKNALEAKNCGISTIFQELELFRELTVAENVFMHQRNKYGLINNNERLVETQKILDEMNVSINPEEKIKNLTTGKQQLVEIAKALAHKCKVLILDEPTSSLSDKETEILFKIIRKLKANGVSCIYISHRLEEVFELCDRVTVIRDGTVVGSKLIHETNKDDLIYMMAGRTIKNLFPQREKNIQDTICFETKNLSVIDPNNPQKYIAEDISFHVKKGEVLGVAGLVGAGRTEMASGIFGVFKKSKESKVFIEEREVDINCPKKAIEEGIAYLSEDRKQYGLVLGMSISNNISLANIRGITSRNVLDETREILVAEKYRKELSIKTPNINNKVSSLSGGNQQKVIIGKWLFAEPKVLILDEPTRGVDVGARYEIYRIINELVSEGVAVVMISSDMPELLGMSDRILVMKQGKIAAELYTEKTSQEEILSYAI